MKTNFSKIVPISWLDDSKEIRWLDNTKIPLETSYESTNDPSRLALAIKRLEIRGAPVLGEAGAYGVALAINIAKGSQSEVMDYTNKIAEMLSNTRPTAVNLSWGINHVLNEVNNAYKRGIDIDELRKLAILTAKRVQSDNIEATYKIGEYGKSLIENGDVIMTVCNAGALACDGIGTATAPLRAAWAEGKKFEVIATETRPLLQGSRLTAWELNVDGIPTRVITDNAAAHIMERNGVTKIFAGADRILSNGIVYNKIGTFGLSILAHYFKNVGFYVCAPTSTIDFKSMESDVKIEQRHESEVKVVMGKVKIAPDSVGAINPAFDRTPPELISSIITELGIARYPYTNSILKLLSNPKNMGK
ncbi:MAG: S-methyl-5-thioribose-1-phosphate isomerase [Candidatus Marsarchaeota archaeon]|nr:S-methyl-5-thioribose-1-phosphate isomerase [Candidatus Marsarchaeota archaeon]